MAAMWVVLLSLMAGAHSLTVVSNATHGSQEDVGVGAAPHWEKSADSVMAGINTTPAFNSSQVARLVGDMIRTLFPAAYVPHFPVAKEVCKFGTGFVKAIASMSGPAEFCEMLSPGVDLVPGNFVWPETISGWFPTTTPAPVDVKPIVADAITNAVDAKAEAEKKRLAEEEKRLADEKAAADKAAADKLAAEQAAAEKARLAQDEVLKNAALQLAEQKRQQLEAENKRLEEEARLAQLQRDEAARQLAEQKALEEEKRLAEEAEAKRLAEVARLDEERKLKEQKELKELIAAQTASHLTDAKAEAERIKNLPEIPCRNFKTLQCRYPQVEIKNGSYKVDFMKECCTTHPWVGLAETDPEFPWEFHAASKRFDLKPNYTIFEAPSCNWRAGVNALRKCEYALRWPGIAKNTADDGKLIKIAESLVALGTVVDFETVKVVGTIPVQTEDWPVNLWALAAGQSSRLAAGLLKHVTEALVKTRKPNPDLLQALTKGVADATKCGSELLKLEGNNRANDMAKPPICQDFVDAPGAQTIRIDIATKANSVD